MRKSYLFDEFILSTPLSIAALLVFGPHAAAVFIVAGAAMTRGTGSALVAGTAQRGPVRDSRALRPPVCWR